MSLAGKIDDLLPGGAAAHTHGHVHVDTVSGHAPSDAIIIPDAHLLFTGDFKRSGVDLVLSGDDRELVLHDYFKGEKRVALASPDGAHLTPDIINALTGHIQLAQADGSPSVAQVIGHVTKLTGTATAIRNGVAIILHQGDNVNKGDVVQSGSDSTLGITFIDGTVFGLASNAKMVLNEMVYDPNGSDNKSLISLVQGTISFVAGATAKHGDMKVDTPVATMGIRGTAVLVEIDFVVPAQGGVPPASFQVLVEPDGTTGSYILFDKTTLNPIATVSQAGTQTIVNGQGTVNFISSAQLSADAQKIITDVFSMKFTDLNNPNTKTAQNFTDSIVPETVFFKLGNGAEIPVTLQTIVLADKQAAPNTPTTTGSHDHIPGPPDAAAHGNGFAEKVGLTASPTVNGVSGAVNYADINPGDVPTVKTSFDSFTYKDAQGNDVKATLTAEQLAAIAAVEVPLGVVQDPNGTNTGSATWTYGLADGALDFLAAGEVLTLTYIARVDNNFAANNETTFKTFTITITGTNDAPVLTTSGGAIAERVDDGNTTLDIASGTITFADADLTDRPVVSTSFSSFRYFDAQGHDVTDTLTDAQKASIAAVEIPLSVVQAAGNTHNGSATWTYSFSDEAFGFIAQDETLTLVYLAQVDDGHGGVVSTPITVSISGGEQVNHVPTIAVTSNAFAEQSNAEQPNPIGSTAPDTVAGTISFTDVDLGDRPVASAFFTTYSYTDASNHALTLTAQNLANVSAPLTVTQAPGNSNNGTATWIYSVADGAFDFLGAGDVLTLTYIATVNDGHAGIVTKPFTVTITGTNDTPIITSAPQIGTLTERAGIRDSATLDVANGTVSFTDVDLTDAHDVTITAVTASGVLAGLADSNTQLGWLTLGPLTDSAGGATGSKTWTFSAADHYFDYLAAGETVNLTYAITVDDHHGGVTTQNVVVTVTGTNDTPVVTAGPQNATIAEQSATTNSSSPDQAQGAVTFTDLDLTDTHAVTITNALTTSGTVSGLASTNTVLGWLSLDPLTNSSNGVTGSDVWKFAAPDNSFDYLADGEHVTLTYALQIDDHHGGVVTQPVTITVNGANDAPSVAADVSGTAGLHAITERLNTAGASTPDTADGSLAFADVDLSDTHTVVNSKPAFSWSAANGNPLSLTLAQQGLLTVASALTLTLHDSTATGAGSVDFHYSAADSAFDFLAAGEKLTVTYDITVSDEHNVTSTKPVTITVTGTNDAPVAVADSDTGHIVESGNFPGNTIFPGVSVTAGNVLSNDTDLDLTDTHEVVGVAKGTVSNTTGSVGTTIAGLYGFLVLNADGSWTYTLDNNNPLTDALPQGAHASDIFSYTESDHHGGFSTATLTIDITGTNDAPVTNASPVAATDVNPGAPVVEQGVNPGNTPFGGVDTASGNVLSNDLDVDTGDTKTVQGVASGPAVGPLTDHVATSVTGTYGSVTINADGTWIYTLNNNSAATQGLTQGQHVSDVFTYTMHDSFGATASATLTIDVTGTNDAPTLAAANAGTLTDTAVKDSFANLTGALAGNDVDNGETPLLSYAVLDNTSHLATSITAGKYGSLTVNANGTYTYVADAFAINALQQGSFHDTFTVQTTDPHGATATATLTVDVTGANDTPSIVGEADPSAQAVMVVKSSSPIVLAQGVNDDLLGLNTETFDGQLAGSASNNGAGRGNFHSAVLHADFSATGPAGVVLGSSSVTAAPFIGPLPGHQDTTNYLSIGGGGTETITFKSDQNVFGLYWGSVDPFNTISFYEGATLVASYSGANVSPLFSNGNQGSFGSNGYVEFSGVGPFNKVVLGSTSNAFELDNISAGSIHSQLGAPITGGTLTVEDRDIGDTLTASVTGNATIHYTGANGSTQLPNGTNISALIDASDVTFDTAQSNGGTQQLHWTYHPTNPNLDFLQAGDKLTITFNAQVNDGHGNVGSQPLTITLVGANNATDTSAFSVVNGTTANDTFSNVGNNAKIFGGGGDDTFVFKPSFGNATIADFDVNHDAINFSASMFPDVAHILASAHQVNQDTIITDAQNDAILLKGVTAGLLQASNFHLV